MVILAAFAKLVAVTAVATLNSLSTLPSNVNAVVANDAVEADPTISIVYEPVSLEALIVPVVILAASAKLVAVTAVATLNSLSTLPSNVNAVVANDAVNAVPVKFPTKVGAVI